MALDPSIILGIKPARFTSPQELYAQKAQYDQNELANRLGGLKIQEFEQGQRDQNQLRSVYSQFGKDAEANTNALFKAGLGKEAAIYAKSQAELGKSKTDAMKSAVEAQLKRFELGGQVMTGVRDQATYDAARQQMTAIPELADAAARMAPIYSPQEVEANRLKAMSIKDQYEQMHKQLVLGESQRHNKATEGLTARGQNMTDARAKEANGKGQYDAERGLLIDPRTGQARQVVGTDGQPIAPKGGSAKMTEDQGKATGWLIQAENAFKNMKAAGFDAQGNPKSAAYPGINDAIANIPGGAPIANSMRSPDRQKFIQGASSLSEALLRAATGAGVNESEAKQKIAELTPQYGEDKATTKQKMAAIPLYIESLKVRAGPGASKAQQLGAGAPGTWDGNDDPLGLRK
jgi:hypothetical protein